MASRRALATASASSPGPVTSRIPLPPPPADGLSSTGKPVSTAARASSASLRRAWAGSGISPGTTGTPAAATVRLAWILSPIVSMADAGGPTKTSPAASQAVAKAAFSARKP
jgi:hypothetical protein